MIRYTLRQLEYFVAVGNLGSISLAAGKVNVSSPSISAAIAQLETEYGTPLFVRQHAQGLSLTQAGRVIYEQAQVVLNEASRIVDIAGDLSGQIRGPLSVGCMVSFAQVVLPSLRKAFVERFDQVRMSQTELDAAELVSALRRAEIDVALTYDLLVPDDLTFIPLLDLPPFAMISSDHSLASRDEVSIEDLRDEPLVLLDLPQSADYFLSFFSVRGIKPQICERSRDLATVRSLVANGFGYSIANVRPLSGKSPDGLPLSFIDLPGDLRPMKMGLLMTHGADSTSVVRAFIEFAKTWMQGDQMPQPVGSRRAAPTEGVKKGG